MLRVFLFLLIISNIFAINYTTKEKKFLKDNPVIYISAMKYWPLDVNGESIHTNYMKLLNKYGRLNLQPVFYEYWSDGFKDAKEGITYGIMALSYSKGRKNYFYYTKPYNYAPYYLIVNKSSNIVSMNDLKNKKIYIAKNSILRDVLKDNNFDIVYYKNPYKKLASKEIDAMLLFYMPENKYINQFKVIKTFINKAGEEHIGINKKYKELDSIIKKVMKEIPYSEIEKIRAIAYKKRLKTNTLLQPQVTINDLITIEDIILIFLLLIGLMVVLYFVISKKFLNLKIKQFLISMFLFAMFILGFILYEMLVFNYYSNKISELKAKAFRSMYLVDRIEHQVLNLDNSFRNAYLYKQNHIKKLFKNESVKVENLLINNTTLSQIINAKNFTEPELTSLAYIQKLLLEVLNIQQQLLQNKLNISIYQHKLFYLIEEFDNLRHIIKNENENEIFIINKKLKYQFLLLIFSIGLFIIESLLVFFMIREKIYNPIKYLMRLIQSFKYNEIIIKKEYLYKDEFGRLIDEFFDLQNKLSVKIDELNQHKMDLEEKVKLEVEKRTYQEKILIRQSRFALMGEMVDAVAHQWKQPLNSISLGVQLLELEIDNLSKEEIEHIIININMQIEHMITTLDEFRTFFKEDKEKNNFCMKQVISRVLNLLKDELLKNEIMIETNIIVDFCIDGSENEFEHLLISLLANAKDIFKERTIEHRKIIIQTKEDEIYYYLEVIDNAGGVDSKIKDKIFELNYTTREEGTGVGLYLARQIAIKHTGTLDVDNTQDGAKFYFKVRKEL